MAAAIDAVLPLVFLRTALLVGILVAVAAGLLVAAHWNDFRSSWPDVQAFFTARHVLVAGIGTGGGEGGPRAGACVACKHFGGECHEIGLMLLVGTPCLYCDVSDAWMFPRQEGTDRRVGRGHVRGAMAGFRRCIPVVVYPTRFAEQSGAERRAHLFVGTLVFNGNPLMRFDGYFIFADLIEIPNLGSRSRAALLQLLTNGLLGMDTRDDRTMHLRGERVLLNGYGLAALLYRGLVLIGILLMLNEALKPYRLESLALVIVALTVAGMLLTPAIRLVRLAGQSAQETSNPDSALAGIAGCSDRRPVGGGDRASSLPCSCSAVAGVAGSDARLRHGPG